MVRIQEKRGAVELSLNLIIMLVIGLTVLGLVIAFVTSFLGSAEDTFKGKLTEDDKTKIEQVRRETGNFAFLSSTVTVTQGSKAPGKLYVKIRNPGSEEFSFSSSNGEVTGSGDLSVEITPGMNGGAGYTESEGTSIKIYGPPIVLDSAQSDGYSLEVYAEKGVAVGTYYAKFAITLDGEDHNQVVTIKVQ